MKNYLVTIRIADGSNYEIDVMGNDIDNLLYIINNLMNVEEIQSGEIICILLSE